MEQVGTVIFIPTMVAFLFMTLHIKTSLQRCFRTLITDQFHQSKQMCKMWWSQYTTKITVQEETLTFSIIMEALQIVNQTNSVIFGLTLSQVFANITLTLLILSVTTVIKSNRGIKVSWVTTNLLTKWIYKTTLQQTSEC
jgi:hypothetical protein